MRIICASKNASWSTKVYSSRQRPSRLHRSRCDRVEDPVPKEWKTLLQHVCRGPGEADVFIKAAMNGWRNSGSSASIFRVGEYDHFWFRCGGVSGSKNCSKRLPKFSKFGAKNSSFFGADNFSRMAHQQFQSMYNLMVDCDANSRGWTKIHCLYFQSEAAKIAGPNGGQKFVPFGVQKSANRPPKILKMGTQDSVLRDPRNAPIWPGSGQIAAAPISG